MFRAGSVLSAEVRHHLTVRHLKLFVLVAGFLCDLFVFIFAFFEELLGFCPHWEKCEMGLFLKLHCWDTT